MRPAPQGGTERRKTGQSEGFEQPLGITPERWGYPHQSAIVAAHFLTVTQAYSPRSRRGRNGAGRGSKAAQPRLKHPDAGAN